MSIQSIEEYAVYIQNAHVSYGQNKILNNYSMNVPRGCIYALLGSSGCGKTTLLRCMVGRKELNSGIIFVLGGKPGTPGSGVPGPRIGYMPQDIALVPEFTVKDTIFYFGRILNMKDNCIEDRFHILKEMLDLPPDNRQVKDCSGGQKRRISFAAAMVHKPELLILDEPTVGLDPELRASLWMYLLKMANEEQTAILITTHYIEEARQAHKIGLMRGGQLLAEATPDCLLQQFNVQHLEDVFLILSQRQEEGCPNNSVQNVVNLEYSMETTVFQVLSNAFTLNKQHLKSLFIKNANQLLRNTSVVSIAFLLPIIQILGVLYSFGGDPRDIPIALINEENDHNCTNYSIVGTASPYAINNCHFENLSCRFINDIQDSMFNLIAYNNMEHALNDVQFGDVIGVIYMSENFSNSFANRINEGKYAQDADLDFGTIKVWLDQSNLQISGAVHTRLLKLFQKFLSSVFSDCRYFSKLSTVPMRFNYEYGVDDESYRNFMISGALLTMIFFLGSNLTCTIIITDRIDGIWDRSIIAGVTSLEIYISHFLTQLLFVFLQTSELIIITFGVWRFEYLGQLWLIFVLVFVQGISGMCFGLCVSILANHYILAGIINAGLFVPTFCLGGIIWPLEAQTFPLQYISLGLPFTIPNISLRQVLKKGYGLENLQVLSGIGVTVIWTIILIILCIFAVKIKRS